MRPGQCLPLPHGPVLMLTCPLLALFRLVCDYAAPKTINCNACSSLIVDCELLLMYVELLMHIHLNLCQISNVKQLNLPIILVLNQWSSVPVTGSKVEVACEGFLTLTSSSPFPWMLPRNVQDSNCKRRWCNLICRRSVTLRSLLLQEVNKLWNQTSTLFLLLFHMRTHTHTLFRISGGANMSWHSPNCVLFLRRCLVMSVTAFWSDPGLVGLFISKHSSKESFPVQSNSALAFNLSSNFVDSWMRAVYKMRAI